MNYYEGNQFFFFLFLALLIGFILKYLGKKHRILYIRTITSICSSNIREKYKNAKLSYRLYNISISISPNSPEEY